MKRWIGLGLAALAMTLPARGAAPFDMLSLMQAEVQRCSHALQSKAPPGPYFTSYAVTDDRTLHVASMAGGLVADDQEHTRTVNVDVRIGSCAFDNTHGQAGEMEGTFPVPLEDDADAVRAAFFLPTEAAWRTASGQWTAAQAQQAVRVHEADSPADFSTETPQHYVGPTLPFTTPAADWAALTRTASARLNQHAAVLEDMVSFTLEVENHYFTNTEGTAVQEGEQNARVDLMALARADDGMPILRVVSEQSRTPQALPQGDALNRLADQVAADVEALRQAPVMEPYAGPAILSGRASAVFFHEIFGHRIEGHRQKGTESGQTFTHQVGEPVLPEFLSVVDDPTRLKWNNVDLVGSYAYDDEGVKAQPVTVVDHGILKNFLMSRSPVKGFTHSNGHGRRAPGYRAVGRQGNLLVESSTGYSDAELRRRLIELCRQQGKPYGIYIQDVNGGFTLTGRTMPQAFEVRPSMVYRVYADGRPDQLVRGVALIGTPLTAFSHILACGDHQEVFNGTCGAESGPVSVSAVAPPLLVEQIELQKEPTSEDRPPILPPPSGGRR